ncbi:hypothetical protein A2U01_0118544, partial [Trifolium medium]|nr:hypothetical protein [Trifolium medium]
MLVKIFKKVHPELMQEQEKPQRLDAGCLTKMHLRKQVVKPQ